MGTFDSIYQQKIRRLEEENRQLRKLIQEDWPLDFTSKYRYLGKPGSVEREIDDQGFDHSNPLHWLFPWIDYYGPKPPTRKPSHWGQPNPNDPSGPPLGYGPVGSGGQVNPLLGIIQQLVPE